MGLLRGHTGFRGSVCGIQPEGGLRGCERLQASSRVSYGPFWVWGLGLRVIVRVPQQVLKISNLCLYAEYFKTVLVYIYIYIYIYIYMCVCVYIYILALKYRVGGLRTRGGARVTMRV